MSEDRDDYVERAAERAVAGAADGLARHGGCLLGTDRWVDDDGHWLRVRGAIGSDSTVEVHYARVLLASTGPDKEPETEAIVFSSGFEERLHTRARTTEPVDGVITL